MSTRCSGAIAASWGAFAVLACSCQSQLLETHVELQHVATRWLPPIACGTPVTAIERALGAPSATFEDGRLRCWTLMLVEKGLHVDVGDDGMMRPTPAADRSSGGARTSRRAAIDVDGECRVVRAQDVTDRALWPVWREAEFHLIVAVGQDGRVARHSFLRVLP